MYSTETKKQSFHSVVFAREYNKAICLKKALQFWTDSRLDGQTDGNQVKIKFPSQDWLFTFNILYILFCIESPGWNCVHTNLKI